MDDSAVAVTCTLPGTRDTTVTGYSHWQQNRPDNIIVSPHLSAKDQIQDLGEKIGVSFPSYHEHLMLGGCWWGDIVSPQLSEENHLFLTETHLWWSVLQILMRCTPPTQLLLVSIRLTGEWVV